MVKKSDKKMKERGLGRGLSALMSDVSVSNVLDDNKNINQEAAEPIPNETVESLVSDTPRSNGVTYVSIDQLERNPEQPRKYFDVEKLEELTQSIKDKGVLQPILVRPLSEQGSSKKARYQIVAGERRWQAALKAQLDAMPVPVSYTHLTLPTKA